MQSPSAEWLYVDDAYPLLRPHFRSVSSLRFYIAHRETNGLAAADAVRLTPTRRLIVNPARVRAWALAEPAGRGDAA